MPTWLTPEQKRRFASEDFNLDADAIIADAVSGARDAVRSAAGSVTEAARPLTQFSIPSLSTLTAGLGGPEPAAPTPQPARDDWGRPEPSPAAPARRSFSIPSLSDLTAGLGPAPAPGADADPFDSAQGADDARGGFGIPSLSSLTAGLVPEAPEPAPSSLTPPAAPLRPGPPLAATSAPAAAGEPTGDIDNSSRAAFVRSAYPHALAAAEGDANLAEIILAKAISENGSIGTGKPIWANNFSGIKGTGTAGSVEAETWEQTPTGPVTIRDRFAAFRTPQEGLAAFMGFLRDNSRYAPALARYTATRDASGLLRDINAAGYATDPAWASKVENIRAHQVAPLVAGLGSAAAGVAGAVRGAVAGGVQAVQDRASAAQYAAGDLTPNQYQMATSEGLDSETAWAVCGPAAAIAFARRTGRNPTMREAVDLARGVGWTSAAGMAGPASQQRLLSRMGIAAQLEEGAPNWQKVIADVQRGNPVTISTPGHYFVAERYDPETGMLDFGQSAKVLKASGGKSWFRPDQLASLGMGDARAALYLDNPESPSASVAAGRAPAAAQPESFSAMRLRLPLSERPAEATPAEAAPPPAPASTSPAASPWNVIPSITLPSVSDVASAAGDAVSSTLSSLGDLGASIPRLASSLGTSAASSAGQAIGSGVETARSYLPDIPLLPDPVDTSRWAQPTREQAGLPPIGPTEPLERIGSAIASVPGRFYEDVGAPIVRRIAPKTGLVEGLTGLAERDFKPAPPSSGADAAFMQSARDVTEPIFRPIEQGISSGVSAVEDVLGAKPGTVRQAAEDISNVLGPAGPLIGGLRFGGRPAAQAAAHAPSPTVRKVAGMLAAPTPAPQPRARRGLLERFGQAMTDDRAALRAFQEDVERQLGRPLAADEMVTELTRRNPNSIVAQRLADEVRPALVAVGDDEDYLAQVLVHTHNVDVAREIGQQAYDAALAAGRTPQQASRAAISAANARAFSGDLSLADTTQALQDLGTHLRSLPDGAARWQRVQDAADAVWEFNRRTLERKRDAGIISQDLYNELVARYPHYVRTDIVDYFGSGPGATGAGPRRIGVSNIGIQKIGAAGTTKERLNPLLSTIDQAYAAESAIVRNQAGQAFEELLRLDPRWQSTFKEVVPAQGVNVGNPATTVPASYTLRNGEQKLTIWQNGVARQFIVPPEYAALVSPQAGRMLGDSGLATGWRTMMDVYKSLITSKNPAFSYLISPLRDIGDFVQREATLSATRGGLPGAVQAVGAVPGILADYARALPDAFAGLLTGTYQGDLGRLMREGAGMVGRVGHDPEALAGALADLRRTNGFEVRTLDDLKRIATNVLTLGAEPVGGRLEQVPRLAAARRAARRGASSLEQTMAARDATVDFQRAGELSRTINEIVPFFNVAMQSGAQVARTFKANPAAYLAALGSTIGTGTLAAEAWNNSDPERADAYADVPDYLKKTGIVVMLPGVTGRSERGDPLPNYLWIPVGQAGALVQTAKEAILNTARGEGGADLATPSGWAKLAAETAGIFSPIRGESVGGALTSVVPPGISTGIELSANRDLFRGAQIATEPRDEAASALSQGSAGLFNAVTGLETRPSQWEYAYRDLGGSAANLALAGSNLAAEALGIRRPKDEERPIQNAPVVGGLVGRLVRDTGGQRLEEAREEAVRIPEEIRPILSEASLRRDEITPVASRYRGAQLTRAEQERWQEVTNTLIAREVLAARRAPEWRERGADKARLVQEAVSRAKQQAAERALRRLDEGEVERRKRVEASRKAG